MNQSLPQDRTAGELGRFRLIMLTVVLGMIATLAAVSSDMFLPSIPRIAAGLATDVNTVALSIAALMFGNALGQVFHGPLSDRYGRKPVTLGTLVVFGAAALAAALSPNVEYLIAFRFVQGLAQAGGRILAVAVARDLFERERLGKMVSEVFMVTSIFTVFNPIIGGFIAQYLPWPTVFLAMAGYGGLCIVLCLMFQPETAAHKDPAAIRPIRIASNFLHIVRNAEFRRYALCSGMGMAGFGAYLGGASPVLNGVFKLEPIAFGAYYAAVTVSFFVGNWLSGRWVVRRGIDGTIAVGAMLMVAGGLTMAGLAIGGVWHPLAIVLPMGLYALGMASVIAQGSAGAVQPFGTMAGAASSLLGLIQFSMIAIAVMLVSTITKGSPVPMAVTIAALGLGATGVYLLSIRPAGRGGDGAGA